MSERLIKIILYFLFANVSIFAAPIFAAEDSCVAVTAQIEKSGPWSVSKWMTAQPKRWERLLSNIKTGSECWLNVARELYVGCDGAICIGVQSAVAGALLHAPDRVLALVGHDNFNEDKVCFPFMSEDEPSEKILRYLDKVEKSLKHVRDPKNKAAKEECLRHVREFRADLVRTK
jgi:hypothetical protein